MRRNISQRIQVFSPRVSAANLRPQSPSKSAVALGPESESMTLPKAGATAMATSTLSDESWQISCDATISGNPLYIEWHIPYDYEHHAEQTTTFVLFATDKLLWIL